MEYELVFEMECVWASAKASAKASALMQVTAKASAKECPMGYVWESVMVCALVSVMECG